MKKEEWEAMDPSELKVAILRLIKQHETTNKGTFLDDTVIASGLGVELDVVQRQLLILESRSLVMLAKAFGPTYSALLTPGGMDALESLSNAQPAAPKRAIGF
jgi:hypothetical protein